MTLSAHPFTTHSVTPADTRRLPRQSPPSSDDPQFAATVRQSPSSRASLTTDEETVEKEKDYCADYAAKEAGRLSRLIPADSLSE